MKYKEFNSIKFKQDEKKEVTTRFVNIEVAEDISKISFSKAVRMMSYYWT